MEFDFSLTYFDEELSLSYTHLFKGVWECPRGIMVKVTDCGIVLSEFEF